MPEKRPTLQEDIVQDIMPEDTERKVDSYSVVLDSIRLEIETMDSFSLKFSVLLKMPVTRVKYLVKRLPNTLWKGKSPSKAKVLVELAEEAGGVAHIVEHHDVPSVSAESKEKKVGGKTECSKCGFPLKKDESFCGFCMTPVEELKGTRTPAPVVVEKNPQIPISRLLFYLTILFVVVILAFVLR